MTPSEGVKIDTFVSIEWSIGTTVLDYLVEIYLSDSQGLIPCYKKKRHHDTLIVVCVFLSDKKWRGYQQ